MLQLDARPTVMGSGLSSMSWPSRDLFSQCLLVFNDPKLTLINGQDFKAGVPVKVEIGFASKMSKVFEGEVVALEPQFRRDLPPALRVICQESIHRLALQTRTRALNQVHDREI